jgi:hypothetical protein
MSPIGAEFCNAKRDIVDPARYQLSTNGDIARETKSQIRKREIDQLSGNTGEKGFYPVRGRMFMQD